MINWGVIGASTIAQEWMINAINKSLQSRVLAIMSRSQQRGEDVQKQFGIEHLYTELDALLENPELDVIYVVSVRKFTASPNTGDFRGILLHSVMYGTIQMLVRYERFGEILHEDCMFMDAVRGFHAPIRQRASIFVRKNTKKISPKPPHTLSKRHILAIF